MNKRDKNANVEAEVDINANAIPQNAEAAEEILAGENLAENVEDAEVAEIKRLEALLKAKKDAKKAKKAAEREALQAAKKAKEEAKLAEEAEKAEKLALLEKDLQILKEEYDAAYAAFEPAKLAYEAKLAEQKALQPRKVGKGTINPNSLISRIAVLIEEAGPEGITKQAVAEELFDGDDFESEEFEAFYEKISYAIPFRVKTRFEVGRNGKNYFKIG